jgi:hypothetical protein
MILKTECIAIVAEIFEFLRGVERYNVNDIGNRYPGVTHINRLWWEAEKLLFDRERVLFGPVHNHSNERERIRDPKRIARRAERMRARGTRAHERAALRLRHAADLSDDAERERLTAAADRIVIASRLRRHISTLELLQGKAKKPKE